MTLDVFLLSPRHIVSLLLQIDNLDASHQHLCVGLQMFNIFDGLHEGVLLVPRQLHLHRLFVLLNLGEFVEGTLLLLELAELIRNVLAPKSHSIQLQLVDDVRVVLLLLDQNFLHLHAVLPPALVFASGVVHRGHARVHLSATKHGRLG